MNNLDFLNRIDQIVKFYELSASGFADKIGVQRSSISHLMAGRNKPSLEFILKVVSSFPDVDLYWLLYGKGSFPNKTKASTKSNATISKVTENKITSTSIPKTKEIDKIIIFYADGSFKAYSEKGD